MSTIRSIHAGRSWPASRKTNSYLPTWLGIAIIAWCPSAFGLEQAELASFLEDARAEMKMPGLRAAVRLPDGRIVRASVGLADKKAETALDDSIGMPGGSTGKTFVAALTMLLVEDGTLSLDDPASKWLGDTQWFNRLPSAEAIRVRHLLSHSSGIRDYPGTVAFNRTMIWRVIRRGSARFEPEELIGFVLGKKPLFAPGEGFHYTDAGYLVLGRLIEAAAGRSYYDLLQERILSPLGLSEVRPQDKSVLTNITPGYMGGGSNLKKDGRMKFDPSSEWTGGGLITNPTMLVRFHGALAEGRIVAPESLAEMVASGWQDPGTSGSHYGFGLFVYDGGNSFGHGGLWPGYRTHVIHFAQTGVTVAVQTNRDGRLDLESLVRRIAAMFSQ
ncbi:MAG: beta-lactamase family protein [Gammaproteobacteria bacterium]|nr:beta-lactamase family protein [Gammaproteobacteria bacterium]